MGVTKQQQQQQKHVPECSYQQYSELLKVETIQMSINW